MARKSVRLVPVPEDIIEKVVAVAEKTGKPLKKVVAEILDKGADMMLAGASLDEVKGVVLALKNVVKVGLALYPSSIVSSCNDDELFKTMHDVGRMCGAMIAARNDFSPDLLEGVLRLVFCDAARVAVSNSPEGVRITLVAPTRNKKLCEAALKFIEGVMYELGYKTVHSEVSEGLVNAYFKGAS